MSEDTQEIRKKVILVDDNPVNLKLARNTLMGKYDVFTVPSAEKLFGLLEKVLPDIILLDVMMPGMDGYEAIEVLKNDERTKDIPVIFLTAKSDTDSELEGFLHGAVDYVSKPFSPQLLLKRVDVHVLVESQKQELKYMNEHLQHEVEEKTQEIQKLQNAVLRTMSSLVEYRDDVTGGHIERSEHLLKLLTGEMIRRKLYYDEVTSWDKKLFYQSAQLHDVGKLAIRDNILLKPEALTAEEYDQMKKHTFFGEKIIERMQENAMESVFLRHAKIMAGTHHERWDGSGYPNGIAGIAIPLQGRLMAIVDVFDALVSDRPYKKAIPQGEALEIVRQGSGSQFDPDLVEIFTTTIEFIEI